WHLFLAMSFMNHTLTLTCALAAVACLMQARRTRRTAAALGSGCAVGAMALIRPLDAVIVGAIIGGWAIAGAGGARLRPLALGALLVGTAATGLLTLTYNANIAGNPLQFPISSYFDKVYGPNSNAYGFGPDRGVGWALDPNPGHSPLDAAINANLNAS